MLLHRQDRLRYFLLRLYRRGDDHECTASLWWMLPRSGIPYKPYRRYPLHNQCRQRKERLRQQRLSVSFRQHHGRRGGGLCLRRKRARPHRALLRQRHSFRKCLHRAMQNQRQDQRNGIRLLRVFQPAKPDVTICFRYTGGTPVFFASLCIK